MATLVDDTLEAIDVPTRPCPGYITFPRTGVPSFSGQVEARQEAKGPAIIARDEEASAYPARVWDIAIPRQLSRQLVLRLQTIADRQVTISPYLPRPAGQALPLCGVEEDSASVFPLTLRARLTARPRAVMRSELSATDVRFTNRP